MSLFYSARASIAIYLLIGSTCVAQGVLLDAEIRGDSAKMDAWYSARAELWKQLLYDSGKPRSGVVLELRVVNSGDGGRAADLVVSVRNVSARTVDLGAVKSYAVADVVVRSGSGTITKMTKEGLDYLQWQAIVNAALVAPLRVKPGYAGGFL